MRGECSTGVLNRLKEERRDGVGVFHDDHFFNAVGCPKAELFFGGEVVLGTVPVGVRHAEGAWNERFEGLLHVWDAG